MYGGKYMDYLNIKHLINEFFDDKLELDSILNKSRYILEKDRKNYDSYVSNVYLPAKKKFFTNCNGYYLNNERCKGKYEIISFCIRFDNVEDAYKYYLNNLNA